MIVVIPFVYLVLLLWDYLVKGIAFFFAMICKMYIESIETTET